MINANVGTLRLIVFGIRHGRRSSQLASQPREGSGIKGLHPKVRFVGDARMYAAVCQESRHLAAPALLHMQGESNKVMFREMINNGIVGRASS